MVVSTSRSALGRDAWDVWCRWRRYHSEVDAGWRRNGSAGIDAENGSNRANSGMRERGSAGESVRGVSESGLVSGICVRRGGCVFRFLPPFQFKWGCFGEIQGILGDRDGKGKPGTLTATTRWAGRFAFELVGGRLMSMGCMAMVLWGGSGAGWWWRDERENMCSGESIAWAGAERKGLRRSSDSFARCTQARSWRLNPHLGGPRPRRSPRWRQRPVGTSTQSARTLKFPRRAKDPAGGRVDNGAGLRYSGGIGGSLRAGRRRTRRVNVC
jgi:hypothetical protein